MALQISDAFPGGLGAGAAGADACPRPARACRSDQHSLGGLSGLRRTGCVENRSSVPLPERPLEKMIVSPSFDQAGIRSLWEAGMSPVGAPVVASVMKIPPPSIRSTAISLATGLHCG